MPDDISYMESLRRWFNPETTEDVERARAAKAKADAEARRPNPADVWDPHPDYVTAPVVMDIPEVMVRERPVGIAEASARKPKRGR